MCNVGKKRDALPSPFAVTLLAAVMYGMHPYTTLNKDYCPTLSKINLSIIYKV
jgi:hypothetical protein